jgi:hypothetical protein
MCPDTHTHTSICTDVDTQHLQKIQFMYVCRYTHINVRHINVRLSTDVDTQQLWRIQYSLQALDWPCGPGVNKYGHSVCQHLYIYMI